VLVWPVAHRLRLHGDGSVILSFLSQPGGLIARGISDSLGDRGGTVGCGGVSGIDDKAIPDALMHSFSLERRHADDAIGPTSFSRGCDVRRASHPDPQDGQP
jgi:hypothetical protein